MRFIIVFAAIALCVSGRTLSRTSRQAFYQLDKPISLLNENVLSETKKSEIVLVEVPHVPAGTYGPPILSAETPRIEVHNDQAFIAPAPQSLSLPELSTPTFGESPREPFATYGIPTLHEEPRTEVATQLLVIPPAPAALPLPEISKVVSEEPAKTPFAAYAIPTLYEEPKTEAPIIPAAIFGPPIVFTEAPKIESTTQQLVIPPAPAALPLPEIPIPVFDEPPRQPFTTYAAPLVHEEPKSEAPIIPAVVHEAPVSHIVEREPIVESSAISSGPYPAQGSVSHYGYPIISSSPNVLSEPIIESSAISSGTYPAQGPVSHYGHPIFSSSPVVLSEPIIESSAISSGTYPAQGPVSHYGDPIISSPPNVLSEPIIESSAISNGPYPAQGPVSHYGHPIFPSSPVVLSEPIIESSAISSGPYPAQGPVSHYGDPIVRLFKIKSH